MKRTPLTRKTPLARGTSQLARTPLARESKKRKAERPLRRAVVEAVKERDGERCWAVDAVPELACWGPLDPDEHELRSARPGGHLDPENVRMICRAHHDWKHLHPIEAARRGLRPWPRGEECP